ncbi:P-loop containing nucleoside triphosphate hydrolase protein [Baffinella frigidus]|nr:P-loop containing nucleoside triphosphate hydrolase protein [Cryptophyta sp. CCMP2293]
MEDLAIAEGAAAAPPLKILNINVGIMGHVDSGKTSLARALSTTLSTAALDKNPQSQVRGITLDLGFSSFVVPLPAHIKAEAPEYDAMQFTLVDCPGHASLIRTIIGGAQIIDLMMLVIDVTKGVQTQTAECLVVGEILMEDMLLVLNKTDLVLMEDMLLVLNKTDLIPDEQRDEKIEKMKKGLEKVFAETKFKQPQMVFAGTKFKQPQMVPMSPNGPFYFAVDHCFPIKGKGTVLTAGLEGQYDQKSGPNCG